MSKLLLTIVVLAACLCAGCESQTTTADVKEIQAEAKADVPKDVRSDDAAALNTDLVGFEGRGSTK